MTANDTSIGQLLSVITGDFALERGTPLPMGATLRRGGVNFSLFAGDASGVTLTLFLPQAAEPLLEFPLDSRFNRTGDVWHCFLAGLNPGVHYGFRVYGGDRNPQDILLDPYGTAVAGASLWGRPRTGPLRSVLVDDSFDWKHDQPLEIPLADSVLYELHVRGFTRHPSSLTAAPGLSRASPKRSLTCASSA